ncbi:MAG: cyclopropane-fatty-acyl-phospholipid synthase family protein [Hyphomicrobiaceae bacterium]
MTIDYQGPRTCESPDACDSPAERETAIGRGIAERLQRALVASLLPARCEHGELAIALPTKATVTCCSGRPGPHARLVVHRWRGLGRILLGGKLGFAEAFIDGDIDCPDLDRLFHWALANEAALARIGGGSLLVRLAARIRHRANANTLSGSRRNIAAHYDLGNDFYAAWLDRGMSYSSALYENGRAQSLEDAQEAKLDRILAMLDLKGGERVLEIGCGWGGLVERLIASGAAGVTALTLSERQRDYTLARLRTAGLSDRADIRLTDYREIGGSYDRIVSIEMIEAVGERYWPVYFETLRSRLAPGGHAVVQAITIRQDRFEDYRREPDFIQRYIFPGGMLPTTTAIATEAARAGLVLSSSFAFGPSYALTLAAWRHRFLARWPDLALMGFDERFRRMWTYYLAYCEAGFATGELDVGLFRLERPAS